MIELILNALGLGGLILLVLFGLLTLGMVAKWINSLPIVAPDKDSQCPSE